MYWVKVVSNLPLSQLLIMFWLPMMLPMLTQVWHTHSATHVQVGGHHKGDGHKTQYAIEG